MQDLVRHNVYFELCSLYGTQLYIMPRGDRKYHILSRPPGFKGVGLFVSIDATVPQMPDKAVELMLYSFDVRQNDRVICHVSDAKGTKAALNIPIVHDTYLSELRKEVRAWVEKNYSLDWSAAAANKLWELYNNQIAVLRRAFTLNVNEVVQRAQADALAYINVEYQDAVAKLRYSQGEPGPIYAFTIL